MGLNESIKPEVGIGFFLIFDTSDLFDLLVFQKSETLIVLANFY
jgi:hypothetical protein